MNTFSGGRECFDTPYELSVRGAFEAMHDYHDDKLTVHEFRELMEQYQFDYVMDELTGEIKVNLNSEPSSPQRSNPSTKGSRPISRRQFLTGNW